MKYKFDKKTGMACQTRVVEDVLNEHQLRCRKEKLQRKIKEYTEELAEIDNVLDFVAKASEKKRKDEDKKD